MALWATKGMGVLFGGVTDEDTSEEGLESVFYNDMCVVFFFGKNLHLYWARYSYQLVGKGRWNSLTLKKVKFKPGKKDYKGKQVQKQKSGVHGDHSDECDDNDYSGKKDEVSPL